MRIYIRACYCGPYNLKKTGHENKKNWLYLKGQCNFVRNGLSFDTPFHLTFQS